MSQTLSQFILMIEYYSPLYHLAYGLTQQPFLKLQKPGVP